MNIKFENENVENTFLDARIMKKKVQKEIVKSTYKRIFQLSSFENTKDFFGSGLDNPHQLKGDLKGYIAWSIDKKYRLILSFDESEVEKNAIIKGIVDYHGTKNRWIVA